MEGANGAAAAATETVTEAASAVFPSVCRITVGKDVWDPTHANCMTRGAGIPYGGRFLITDALVVQSAEDAMAESTTFAFRDQLLTGSDVEWAALVSAGTGSSTAGKGGAVGNGNGVAPGDGGAGERHAADCCVIRFKAPLQCPPLEFSQVHEAPVSSLDTYWFFTLPNFDGIMPTTIMGACAWGKLGARGRASVSNGIACRSMSGSPVFTSCGGQDVCSGMLLYRGGVEEHAILPVGFWDSHVLDETFQQAAALAEDGMALRSLGSVLQILGAHLLDPARVDDAYVRRTLARFQGAAPGGGATAVNWMPMEPAGFTEEEPQLTLCSFASLKALVQRQPGVPPELAAAIAAPDPVVLSNPVPEVLLRVFRWYLGTLTEEDIEEYTVGELDPHRAWLFPAALPAENYVAVRFRDPKLAACSMVFELIEYTERKLVGSLYYCDAQDGDAMAALGPDPPASPAAMTPPADGDARRRFEEGNHSVCLSLHMHPFQLIGSYHFTIDGTACRECLRLHLGSAV